MPRLSKVFSVKNPKFANSSEFHTPTTSLRDTVYTCTRRIIFVVLSMDNSTGTAKTNPWLNPTVAPRIDWSKGFRSVLFLDEEKESSSQSSKAFSSFHRQLFTPQKGESICDRRFSLRCSSFIPQLHQSLSSSKFLNPLIRQVFPLRDCFMQYSTYMYKANYRCCRWTTLAAAAPTARQTRTCW